MLQIKMEAITPSKKVLETFDTPIFSRSASYDLNSDLVDKLVVITKNVKCLETVEETVNTLKRKFEELEASMENIRMKFRKLGEMRLEIRPNQSEDYSDGNMNCNSIVKSEDSQEIMLEVKNDDCVIMDSHSLKDMILSNSEQFLVFVKQEKWMFEVLCKFCGILNTQIAILCRSKLGAMHLALNMNNKGYPIKALCADLSRKKRNRIVSDVLKGNIKMLTLTASLDVEGLKNFIQNSIVIIYNMPQTWESIAKLFGIEQSKWKGLAIYTLLERNDHYYKRFKHLSEDQVHRIVKKIAVSTDKYCLFHV